MQLARDFIEIDLAGSVDNALCMTNYHIRREYIIAKRGRRAVAGFFKSTNRNVLRKFVQVWSEENVN